jgi:hypothetical protein
MIQGCIVVRDMTKLYTLSRYMKQRAQDTLRHQTNKNVQQVVLKGSVTMGEELSSCPSLWYSEPHFDYLGEYRTGCVP